MRRFSVIILLALTLICSAPCSAYRKAVAVPFIESSIRMDGSLNEPAWKNAGRVESFEHYMRSGDVRNQTEVLLLHDRNALYIGYKCRESNMSALKSAVTAHDGSLWDDDAADLFLDPNADGAGYYQFIANTKGVRYDGLGSDSYGFNPKWEAKAQIGRDGWTLEMRIPYSEIGAECPKPGDFWLGNLCREEQPSGELSCWSATKGGFASPGAFGEIVFGELAVKMRRDIDLLSAQLGEIKASDKEGQEMLDRARLKIAEAGKLVPPEGRLSPMSYGQMQLSIDDVRHTITELRAQERRSAMGGLDYLVWEMSPWKHHAPREDTSSIDKQAERLDVLLLAGQTESRALMVSNVSKETMTARISVDGTKHQVEVLLPTFVRTADDRPFPDALVPPDPIGQITVPVGETRQIWLNFRSDEAGKYEGTLTISPLIGSQKDVQVKIALEAVAPSKDLPKPVSFTWDYLGDAEERGLVDQYMQTMLDHGITAFWITGLRYMPRPKADDQGNLMEPMDWTKFREQVKLKWKPGRKLYISMDVWEKASERPIYNGKFDSPGWRVAFKKVLAAMAGVLRDMGLSYDDYYVNPVDESVDERYVAIARLVREADPKIRIIADTIGSSLDEVKTADKVTDHWVPHFNAFRAEGSRESIAFLKSTGKPLGFYFYSEGSNEKAQDSYNHYLWRLWFGYSQGLDGLLGYWTATQHYGDPWNRHQTDAQYDPSLFYPGNGCVITSRRWEAWRRGLEDVALLMLCESSGVEKSLIDRAVESVMKSAADPAAASKAREDLIRALAK